MNLKLFTGMTVFVIVILIGYEANNLESVETLFERKGYSPSHIEVNDKTWTTYCGRLMLNGNNNIWFKIDKYGLNLYREGIVIDSANDRSIYIIKDQMSLEDFRSTCKVISR